MNFVHAIDGELSLRLIEPRHAEELFALIDGNRERLRPWLRWAPQVQSVDEVREAIAEWLGAFGQSGGFTAFIACHGQATGLIYGLNVDLDNRRMEVGYWLDGGSEGKGMVSRALGAFVDHAFGSLAMNRIALRADVDNRRSRAAAERNGFVLEGIGRKAFVRLDGEVRDNAYYGLVVDDQTPVRSGWKFTHRLDDEIELAPPTPQDAAETFEAIDANRQHLTAWLNWPHLTQTVDDVVQSTAGCGRDMGARRAHHCNILLDGRMVGRASLVHVWCEHREADRMIGARAEVGYWLAADVQGRGIMTRTVNALLDHAFSDLKLERVYLHAEPDNCGSCGVAERCGFTYEGTMRHVAKYNGRFVDHRVYAMLAEQWRALRAHTCAEVL